MYGIILAFIIFHKNKFLGFDFIMGGVDITGDYITNVQSYLQDKKSTLLIPVRSDFNLVLNNR